jgi:hypothetical protein
VKIFNLMFALILAISSSAGVLASLAEVTTETTLNVRDYGAKGDGIADDTAAIRRAISAVPFGGGTVYLPCGTYLLSSGLTIFTSHTTLTSDGGCATLKLTGSNGFVALTASGKGLSPSVPLIRDTAPNTFTVGSGELRALGMTAGSYAIISDQAVASNGPGSPPISTQQVVKILAINGDTATIEGNFAHDFTLQSPYPANQGCCPYVQRVIQPIEGVHILHLKFDGTGNSGSRVGALRLYCAVDSEIGSLVVSSFMQTPGPTEAFLLDTGYQNNFHDITCTNCGNGADADGHSMAIRRQTLATMSNITISNSASQYTFSFNLASVNFSTATNVSIDGGGADGRPFKLLRANHNTFDRITAKNSGHGKNGINVTDISTHNIFNACIAVNNDGTGIKLFGNFNHHNVFRNCTSQRNTSGQFGQGKDAFGNFGDHFTTIEGGVFCCERGHSNLLQINSDDFTITDARVYDDQGLAPNGIVIRGSGAVLRHNKVSGFKTKHDVVYMNE